MTTQKQALTQEYVKSLFDYNGGNLYWKISSGKRIKPGDIAGTLRQNGYVRVSIDKKDYPIHRIIWLYHYGYIPECQIDHIDRVRNNNKIENLRLALNNCLDNGQNHNVYKTNTSNYNGVHWHKHKNKWHSQITKNYKRIHLGYFNDINDAIKARLDAEKIYFPFKPNN